MRTNSKKPQWFLYVSSNQRNDVLQNILNMSLVPYFLLLEPSELNKNVSSQSLPENMRKKPIPPHFMKPVLL